MVVGDTQTSEEHRSLRDFIGTAQSSLAHESQNSALGVIFEAVTRVDQACQQPIRVTLAPLKIAHVKRAVRREDAPYLAQGFPPRIRLDVVKHEGGEDTIEGRIRIGQFIGKALIELNAGPGLIRLSSGPGKRLWIGIESNDAGAGDGVP
jgi:hypothetical protein